MKIVVARVAKSSSKWADLATKNYLQRIGQGWKVEEKKFKLSNKVDVIEKREQESEQVLQFLTPNDCLITLDERGDAISSEQFAGWLERHMNKGTKRIVFAIGGPFGHSPALRERSWKSLAFSPMVLNHELARIILAEQLYRASTIIWGGKYHH